MSKKGTFVLCVLDGFGYSDNHACNAIAQAHTPFWDYLWQNYPHALLGASEEDVGLPHGQMGNSEVGHLNIGAGRIILQTLPRIQDSILGGHFKKDKVLCDVVRTLKETGRALHLVGLLSDGGVHSHQDHAIAYAQFFAEEGITVYLHAITDGRDTAPYVALEALSLFKEKVPSVKVVTIAGRYYAMDRDKNYDRLVLFYDALSKGDRAAGSHDGRVRKTTSLEGVIQQAHREGVSDEFILPTILEGYQGMVDGDALFFFNFRADRMRQMAGAMISGEMPGFDVKKHHFSRIISMSEYDVSFNKDIDVLYGPIEIKNGLGEYLSKLGLKQLRIAETEKYAHVTFFFNGGVEEPFPHEDRVLVPSSKVKTYDLKPEMSAYDITDKIVSFIEDDRYDVIVVNYANADMVGHTGNMDAAIKAVEALDISLKRVYEALQAKEGMMLITADHGNADVMCHEEGGYVTSHSLNPVPLLVCGCGDSADLTLSDGRLCDVAPTFLDLMGMSFPPEMSGKSLVTRHRG